MEDCKKANSQQTTSLVEEIGRLVVFQTDVEDTLRSLLGGLLKLSSKQCSVVTSNLRYRNLRDMLLGLVQLELAENEEARQAFKNILRTLDDIHEKRNTYAHQVVESFGINSDWIKLSSRVRPNKGLVEKLDIVDISELRSAVEKGRTALDELIDCLFDALPSLESWILDALEHGEIAVHKRRNRTRDLY